MINKEKKEIPYFDNQFAGGYENFSLEQLKEEARKVIEMYPDFPTTSFEFFCEGTYDSSAEFHIQGYRMETDKELAKRIFEEEREEERLLKELEKKEQIRKEELEKQQERLKDPDYLELLRLEEKFRH